MVNRPVKPSEQFLAFLSDEKSADSYGGADQRKCQQYEPSIPFSIRKTENRKHLGEL